MSISVEEFISRRIPEIVAEGRRGLNALFCTYNSVHGLQSGRLQTSKPGLSVQIHAGGAFPDWRNFLVSTIAFQFGDQETLSSLQEQANVDSCASQKSVESTAGKALEGIPQDEGVLVVIYAGLRAFNETIRYISNLYLQLPRAVIVVLTCTCELSRKEEQLRGLVSSRVISDVLITKDCGGHQDMAQIVRALVDKWPAEDQCEK